jgi:hypothetical protein
MKIALALMMALAFFSGTARAQEETVEQVFGRDVKKFSREIFSVGEDASSGFDYVIYKNGSKVVKIRSIHSSCCADPEIEGFYYENGAPVLYVRLQLPKKRLKAAAKGLVFPLAETEKMYLKDSELVKWSEKGKTVPSSDPRWAEREKDVLLRARDELDGYPILKEQ